MVTGNETELVQQGAKVATDVAQKATGGVMGVLKGLINAPVAMVKGGLGGVIGNMLWYSAAIGLAAVTGLLKPVLNMFGKGEWADSLAATLDKDQGGMPGFLMKILGYGAAAAGTVGAGRAAIGEITGSGAEEPQSAGMGIGGAVAIAAVAAVGIGALVKASDDGKPGTPAATPGKAAGARAI
jgi:hypothetical protein